MENTFLRTPETFEEYRNKKAEDECFICNSRPIRNFNYWKIIKNDFSYDAVAETHHMLVPKGHCGTVRGADILEDERTSILNTLEKEQSYDSIIVNFKKAKSFQSHLHYHLVKWKKRP